MARAAAAKPLNAQRLASLARRASECFPLRHLTLALAGAERSYTVALPADPDAPLDRFATVLATQRRQNTDLRGGLRSMPNPDTSHHPFLHDHDPAKTSTPPPTSVVLSPSASPDALAADQARRSVASGAHMPYWGLLWPSGLALAEALLTDGTTSRGARALELGCGLGVTATAGIERGLSLTAMDCFTEALLFTRYNARRNIGREPRTVLADWRSVEGRAACLDLGPLDIVLAADVLYEEEDIAPLLELAPRLLAPGGTFWLAEPGRRVSKIFVEAARARGWRSETHIRDRAWPPDGDVVRVAVHRFEQIV